jgi:hypothetical protein
VTSAVRWLDQAACAGADTERFFLGPRDGGRGRTAETAQRRITETANRYCARCPVVAECAAWADKHRSIGLFGGSLRRAAGNGGGGYRRDRLVPAAAPRARPHRRADGAA